MTTDYYRKLFMRHWWILAICAVCVGAGSILGSRFLTSSTPTYTVSALVEAQFIGTYSDTNGYMATEAKLCDSSKILSTIVANYPGLTVSALASEISASTLTGTHLIQINVTDTNAARAAKIATDDANALIADQQQAGQQLGAQAAQQIQNQLNAIQSQINQTSNDLNQARQSGNQNNIASLDSQLSGLREQQALLQFSLAQMQLTASEGVPTLSLAQQPEIPSAPVRSLLGSTIKYAISGILLGLVLGLVLVLGLDLIARRQSSAAVAESAGVASAK